MHSVGEGVIKRYKVSQERRHLEAFGGTRNTCRARTWLFVEN